MIPPLAAALADRGFDTLTAVQEAVTDPALQEADLLVSAQTGSGKTVGFGLAIAPTLLGTEERFGPAAAPLALVVAPTRELAFQVMQELRWLYAGTGAQVTACVGGMDIRQERRALERGTHIVVGTPGRLCDHIRREALDLGEVRAVVLDEADEMLDLGFREDLEFILASAPETRRTLLFSATVSPMIARLAEQFQRDARRINTIGAGQQHADIAYSALRVAHGDSDHAIFNLLRYHAGESAIVFANTRAQVTHLAARLSNRGLAVVSLSGELSQSERGQALQAMRDGRARICVATDVAARGIDLPNLNLVIHADLPSNTESLLHRSGRTGRAGRKGMSALIVPPKAVKKAERLLKWAKIRAEWTVPPSADDILRQDEARLLDDPQWQEAPSETEQALAARLLEAHGAEAVAAALVRLHLAREGAPEELQSPDQPVKRAPREFGPSRWVALSVGRDKRAEPRWLLPMLLRAGNLDKTAIGAIRVQDSETFVEIAEPAFDGFLAALGPEGALDEGIAARALDGVPQTGPRPRGPAGPEGKGPRKPFRPATAAPDDAAPRPKPKPFRADRIDGDGPRPKAKPYKADRPTGDDTRPRGKPYKGDRVDGDGPRPKSKPYKADRSTGDDTRPRGKPYKAKPTDGDGARGKPYKGKPAKPGKPRAERPGTAGKGKRTAGQGGDAPPRRPRS
ncbi:DEAD/DEAH box helicase [Pseudoponticoccus marisrubri]|uniref:DEAD/DEAH box helicase n=1 Tax=Pseudoponticoccus marisrubri TaxID=1685382 RepID=A0A0W7WHC3_9RHOB|nr:DEAD/DEAH box helicase [Pseudoponticoccus marisrubri]KUF09935.1 DEAD/DEAH box helicase [Pseudoponticoccus marisrubri]